MKTLGALIIRNLKMFFKDKGMVLTSLITPAILLILYVTFLGEVYKDAFATSAQMNVSETLINATIGGQLLSSILAVSCVTVAFCSNLLSVQDKVSDSIKDLTISPVKKSTLAISYYVATVLSTLIVCLVALALCLIYIACVGWYMSFGDIMLIILDIFMLVLFGTALSSIVNVFLKTEGQMQAVGVIVSSMYGFICGAYMPISTFGQGVQNFAYCLPGTHGTALLRNHALAGVFREMEAQNFPKEAIDGIKASIDCTIVAFDNNVEIWQMYLILCLSVVALIGIYILINVLPSKIHFKKPVKK